MCTTVFLIRNQKRFKLLIAFNRDEFYRRETLHLKEYGDLVYPLDVPSNGTFFCFNKATGNICVLLNNSFVDNPYVAVKVKRGHIPIEFCSLDYSETPAYIEELEKNKFNYNGFNLIYGNLFKAELFYFSNNTIVSPGKQFDDGVHAISNWCPTMQVDKLDLAKELASDLNELSNENEILDAFHEIMRNKKRLVEPSDVVGVPQKSALFVTVEEESDLAEFGTRHSLVLGVTDDEIVVSERTFDVYDEVNGVLKQKDESDFEEIKRYSLN